MTVDWSRLGDVSQLPAGVSTEVAGARLVIRGVHLTDAGKYLCTAANAAGKAWGTGEVIVEEVEKSISTSGKTKEGGGSTSTSTKEEDEEVVVLLGSNLELKCPQSKRRHQHQQNYQDEDNEGEEDHDHRLVWWRYEPSREGTLPPNAEPVDGELRLRDVQLYNAGRYLCTTSSARTGVVLNTRAVYLKVKGEDYFFKLDLIILNHF